MPSAYLLIKVDFRLKFFCFCSGEAVAPSTYVTVVGEDGRTLSSPVRAGTLNPEWNWSETFNVCFFFGRCFHIVVIKMMP